MALIEWSSSLSLGIDRVDKEHQQLVTYINELHDALGAGKANQVIGNILKKVRNYTRTHFSNEETLLRNSRYPNLAEHQALHQQFVGELDQIEKSAGNNAGGASLAINRKLKDWLVQHINKADREYAAFINKK